MTHIQDRVRYQPEQTELITTLSELTLRDAARLPDALADRNRRSLQRLQAALGPWQTGTSVTAEQRARIAAAFAALCRSAAGAPRAVGLCATGS